MHGIHLAGARHVVNAGPSLPPEKTFLVLMSVLFGIAFILVFVRRR